MTAFGKRGQQQKRRRRNKLIVYDPRKGCDFRFRFSEGSVFSSRESNLMAFCSQYAHHTSDSQALKGLLDALLDTRPVKCALLHIRRTCIPIKKPSVLPDEMLCADAGTDRLTYLATGAGLAQIPRLYEAISERARWFIYLIPVGPSDVRISDYADDLGTRFFESTLSLAAAVVFVDSDDDCLVAVAPACSEIDSMMHRMLRSGQAELAAH